MNQVLVSGNHAVWPCRMWRCLKMPLPPLVRTCGLAGNAPLKKTVTNTVRARPSKKLVDRLNSTQLARPRQMRPRLPTHALMAKFSNACPRTRGSITFAHADGAECNKPLCIRQEQLHECEE